MADFIKYRGVDYKVVYVDTSLTTGVNDGSTKDDALQAYPRTENLSGNCFYLFRKSSFIPVNRATCSNNNVILCGMPSAGQLFFDNLPLSVQTTWGVDSLPTTTMFLSGGPSLILSLGSSPTNSGYGLFNLSMYSPSGTSLTNGTIKIWGGGVTIDGCSLNVSGQPITGNQSLNIITNGIILDSCNGLTINNCTFTVYNGSAVSIVPSTNATRVGSNTSISNCNFNLVSPSAVLSNYDSKAIYNSDTIYSSYFDNININFYKSKQDTGYYTAIDLYTIANGCIFSNININDSVTTANLSKGIEIQYTSGSGSNRSDSRHLFKNINLNTLSTSNAIYSGIDMSTCNNTTFDNITINAPNVRNTYSNSYGIRLGTSNGNYIKNSNLNIGGNISSAISNSSTDVINGILAQDCAIFDCNITSPFKGISAITLLTSGCNITGSLTFTPSNNANAEIEKLEAHPRSDLFSLVPNILESPNLYDSSIQSIVKINTLVNFSTVPYNINVGRSLVAVEKTSGNNIFNINIGSNQDTGKIYLNNYPTEKFWYAKNSYLSLETSSVQFVTSEDISSGYSLRTSSPIAFPSGYDGSIVSTLVVSPSPFDGFELDTTGLIVGKQYYLRLHFASKFLTSINGSQIYFNAKIPVGTSNWKTISSNSCIMEVDNSTLWYGDSPLSKSKFVVPFILDRIAPISTRIFVNKYVPTGAQLYISPRIIISDNP